MKILNWKINLTTLLTNLKRWGGMSVLQKKTRKR